MPNGADYNPNYRHLSVHAHIFRIKNLAEIVLDENVRVVFVFAVKFQLLISPVRNSIIQSSERKEIILTRATRDKREKVYSEAHFALDWRSRQVF